LKNKKIKTQEELVSRIKKEKQLNKIIGFTNGCFDILHLGHIRYLQQAKKESDILIIGVNSDDSIKRLKGDSRPVNNQDARLEVLSAIEFVDFLTIFYQDTPEELIQKINPNILFKGKDWEGKKIAGAEYIVNNGGKLKLISYEQGYSTTNTISKMF